MDHTDQTFTTPTEWSEVYTEQDIRDVGQVLEYLNKRQLGQAWLCARTAIKATKLNQILRGKYPSPVSRDVQTMLDTIERHAEEAKRKRSTPFVPTSVYRAVEAACKRARLYRSFCIVSASVGTGKTTALLRYKETHDNVLLIKAVPDMTALVMLDHLLREAGAKVEGMRKNSQGTKADRMDAIINRLTGTDALLILDEADNVTPQTLEYIRRISDNAEIGVVLSGTARLNNMLRPDNKRGLDDSRFGQISSRVNYWPPIIKTITEDDAHAVVQAAFSDDSEVTDEIRDAFWQMCGGSMRVLCKSLIPGVRDFGLAKNIPLSAQLIFQVGQQALGFTKMARA